jgi:RNA methyltransferase, TrmH family
MERIASRQNPAVKRFREAARAGGSTSGTMLLDGEHLVLEAITSGIALELVALSDAPVHDPLADAARTAGARVLRASDQVLAAMSPVRQPTGVVALAPCAPASLDRSLEPGPQLVFLLAGIQDAGNVGAIVRVAEGCGATGVICAEGTADPFGWKALRGAMGSTFRVPVAVKQSAPAVAGRAHERGIRLIATVPREGTPLPAADLRAPVAIMLGAEGAGLAPEHEAAADERLTIPMRPPVESLNVAIAAALIAYEASRQREDR